MNNDPRSHGLWEASAPSSPPSAVLKGDISADVVIVGAGFTGLSAALHLALDHRRVIVLEAEEIGFGGSGRNVGLVNAGMWIRPAELPRILGEVHGNRLLSQLGEAPNLVFDLVARFRIECQAVRAGTLHCAVNEGGLQEIRSRAQQWKALGAPVELLDAATTRAKVGGAAYRGALLDYRAGTIQPLAYARGLAAAAVAEGAVIHTKSPVVEAVDLGAEWRVRTPTGTATAPQVIVATNAYSTNAWEKVADELVRLPYFNLATRPLSDALRRAILAGGEGLWDTRSILSSLRLDREGRMIFGSVGALREWDASIHRNWARRELLGLFPQLGAIQFDHEWYGWIGMTKDALPRFHRLGRNVISMSGYNGRGIAPGTTFGRDLARLAAGRITDADLSVPVTGLVPRAFRGMRESFYEVGAAAAHLMDARINKAMVGGRST